MTLPKRHALPPPLLRGTPHELQHALQERCLPPQQRLMSHVPPPARQQQRP
jgi:hypothetical protein